MNLEEFLTEHGIPFRRSGEHEHAREGWIQLDCPDCNQPEHFRLGLNLHGQYANCWSCGPKKFLNVLAQLSNCSISQIIRDVSGTDVYIRPEGKTRGRLQLPTGIDVLLPAHIKYLRDRGFDPDELIRLWSIRGIGIASYRLQWRIFIPIKYRDQTVSWTTRSIGNHPNVRYQSASSFQESIPHKDLLYGQDYCRHSIIVCEGPVDVWRIGPGSVATFGTAIKQSQLSKIARYPVRVICLDSDAQGKAEEICSLLKALPGETFNIVLDSKDPGEATRKEIKTIRKHFLEV